MKKRLKITVLMDGGALPENDPTFSPNVEEPSTEYYVTSTLRELGHSVEMLGVWDDVKAIVSGIEEQKPDVVFNLTEQFRGDRKQDRNVAALLEMLGVPFTGTGTLGMMLTRNKAMSKRLLRARRIKVPDFAVLRPGREPRIPKSLQYPLVVKPLSEDSSEGIFNASLARDYDALKERTARIHARFGTAIAEEFIEGRELYVSILGNKRLKVLPFREIFFSGSDDGPVLATYTVKWDDAYRKKWDIHFDFTEVEAHLKPKIERVCKRAYSALHLHDWGRIDLRLTPDGNVVILEANANADIAYGEEVAESADKAGIPYDTLLERIIRSAIRRHNE